MPLDSSLACATFEFCGTSEGTADAFGVVGRQVEQDFAPIEMWC
jgi:hypothetical protein